MSELKLKIGRWDRSDPRLWKRTLRYGSVMGVEYHESRTGGRYWCEVDHKPGYAPAASPAMRYAHQAHTWFLDTAEALMDDLWTALIESVKDSLVAVAKKIEEERNR